MKNYIGLCLIILGSLMLIFSYFDGELVDYNWYTLISLLLIIVGIVAHIAITKRS